MRKLLYSIVVILGVYGVIYFICLKKTENFLSSHTDEYSFAKMSLWKEVCLYDLSVKKKGLKLTSGKVCANFNEVFIYNPVITGNYLKSETSNSVKSSKVKVNIYNANLNLVYDNKKISSNDISYIDYKAFASKVFVNNFEISNFSYFDEKIKASYVKFIPQEAKNIGVNPAIAFNIPKIEAKIDALEYKKILVTGINISNEIFTAERVYSDNIQLDRLSLKLDKEKIQVTILKVKLNNNKISESDFYIDDIIFNSKYSFVNTKSFDLNGFDLQIGKAKLSGDFSIEDSEFKKIHVKFDESCENVISAMPGSWSNIFSNADINGRIKADILISESPSQSVEYNCVFKNMPEEFSSRKLRNPFKVSFARKSEELVGPGTSNWVPFPYISNHMVTSLITTEDATFFKHKGINTSALVLAIIDGIKGRPRGGSTITMQLAKNIWLNESRTISRKVQEIFLAMYLEQEFSKEEILELYMNIIEFGPEVFGISKASKHYFKTFPVDLTLKQSLFLASILPMPRANYFNNGFISENRDKYLNSLLAAMKTKGRIDDDEYNEAMAEILRN